MIKTLSILFLVIATWFFQVEDGCDYNHPKIQKRIQRMNDSKQVFKNNMILPDSLVKLYGIQGKFFQLEDSTKAVKYPFLYVGRVNCCRAGGCDVDSKMRENAAFEYFDYFIIYDSLAQVAKVQVFNYAATHGQEITSRAWLKQFQGYDAEKPLEVNLEIDAISGATISVYAITFDVSMKTRALHVFLGK